KVSLQEWTPVMVDPLVRETARDQRSRFKGELEKRLKSEQLREARISGHAKIEHDNLSNVRMKAFGYVIDNEADRLEFLLTRTKEEMGARFSLHLFRSDSGL